MKTTFDTDAILFQLLKNSSLKTVLKGGDIYVGDDRPNDSDKEDIVVNSIDLTQDYLPQIGTSNVNIFVPDKNVKIGGKQQLQADRARLKELSEMVIETMRNTTIKGLALIITNQTIIEEPEVKQHFTNIRINWVVCI